MKFTNKRLALSAIVMSFTLVTAGPISAYAATSPTLAGTDSYSVLGATTVTNTGSTTTTGDVGVSAGTAITGFPAGIAGGNNAIYLHSNDASAIAAQADNLVVFGALDQSCDYSYADGQDLTLISPLVAGTYCSAGSFLLTGNLTLSGSGVWIFKTVSSLVTSTGSSVTGGNPCSVWWRIGSSATLATTTSFIGNIFALTSIDLQTGATLNGRALAQTGAVTLDANTISGPTCTVIPAVVPALPNTGYTPENNTNGLLLAAIATITTATLLFIAFKKRTI